MQKKPLNRTNVTNTIERNVVGNYWLGNYLPNGIFLAQYVGRSDKCLQKRLLNHVSKDKFEAFSFREAGSIKEAYEVECREWHMLGRRLSNVLHPRTPRHLPYPCPYCGFISRLELANRIESPVGVQ